jgi:ABC-type uncharacterized transport system ATPase subunit
LSQKGGGHGRHARNADLRGVLRAAWTSAPVQARAEIAERHLFPTDLLVGIIGAEGAGKSTLIRGIFPALN